MSTPVELQGQVLAGYLTNKSNGKYVTIDNSTIIKVKVTTLSEGLIFNVDVDVSGLIQTYFTSFSKGGLEGTISGLSNGINYRIEKLESEYIFTANGDLDEKLQVSITGSLSTPTPPPPTDKSVKNALRDEVKNFLKSKK